MNTHPLFVHFPIALLIIYSVLEVGAPILKWALALLKKERSDIGLYIQSESFTHLKAFLVIVGTLFALPTLQTGESAEHLLRAAASDPRAFRSSTIGQLIQIHSTYATISVYVYALLGLMYISLLEWFQRISVVKYFSNIFDSTSVKVILALFGIFFLMVTGALGGAITYGPDVDPIVKIIYSWFF